MVLLIDEICLFALFVVAYLWFTDMICFDFIVVNSIVDVFVGFLVYY